MSRKNKEPKVPNVQVELIGADNSTKLLQLHTTDKLDVIYDSGVRYKIQVGKLNLSHRVFLGDLPYLIKTLSTI